MKLDFDPRKNITKLDYFIMPLNKINFKIRDLLVVRSIVKNWYDVLFFRIGLKKPGFVMQLRNGKKIKINRPEDYFEFFNGYQYKKIKLANLSFKKTGRIITFRYKGHKVKFYCPKEKESDILDLLLEEFVYHIYSRFDYKDKIVVNVGGNIGDSSMQSYNYQRKALSYIHV